MAFDNDTNRGRVKKILDTLALIKKSAASKGAGQEDIDQMLEPLYKHLGQEKPKAASVEDKPSEQIGVPNGNGRVGASAPPWASVIDMAKEADLKDLTRAVAIMLNRLDEEVFAEK